MLQRDKEMAIEILAKDLHDLRAEIRENFRCMDGKLDKNLTRCVEKCPTLFVGKGDFLTMTRWVKGTAWAVGVLFASFILTQGEQAVQALERVLKLL